jgi:hypothetical protein
MALESLPNELLLHIAAQFTNLTRNEDLANLSLVSHRFQVIAQEVLVRKPKFNLIHIEKFMWELGRRPHLRLQVRSLEK